MFAKLKLSLYICTQKDKSEYSFLKVIIMEYREHLVKKFRRYQAILGEEEEKIDLESISLDFCEVDGMGRIKIKYIPSAEDYVYFTVKSEDILVPLSELSDKTLGDLVEVMRKAMIIEELRNIYVKS